MPLLSVGIPAYKAAHLGQAIASVLAQTLDDFELVISDDSPDGSAKRIVERFADPRIRLIEGPRAGLIANSVRLWEATQSDYLKFVYDDDFLLPFALRALVEGLSAHTDAGYAFSHRYWVDAAGRIITAPTAIKTDKPTLIEGTAVAAAMLGGIVNFVGEPSNILIRRSAFAGPDCLSRFVGLPVRTNIDVTFYLNAALRGACVGVPEFHAAFRRHGEQVSQQSTAPAYGYAFLEWEIFIRGAVHRGLVDPTVALDGLARLEPAYLRLASTFPELAPFLAGLNPLRARLQAGETGVLDEAFRTAAAQAEEAVADREAAAKRIQ